MSGSTNTPFGFEVVDHSPGEHREPGGVEVRGITDQISLQRFPVSSDDLAGQRVDDGLDHPRVALGDDARSLGHRDPV